MKDKRIISIFIVLGVIIAILGGTLAYWSWTSTNAQKTNVTFTIGSNFSCSAEGGGTITNTNYFVPTDCTNSTYAIKRTITTSITNNGSNPVYMDMWLTINSIGSGLSQSNNFKYALTTNNNSCTTGVVSQGNFNGKVANDKINLLHNLTSGSTYYLYVWLDAAETSPSTMNQSVSLSLGGECTDQAPTTFSGTIYRFSTEIATIGSSIARESKQAWCANSTQLGNSCDFGVSWDTQSECEAYIANQNMEDTTCGQGTITTGLTSYETDPANLNKTFYLKHMVVDDIITESYVGFIVTPAMATANPGMIAGTYYLRGLDTYDVSGNCKSQYLNSTTGNCESPYYESNKTVLQTAFGSTYCTYYSSYFYCSVSGLYAYAYLHGNVEAHDGGSAHCNVYNYGYSYCDE